MEKEINKPNKHAGVYYLTAKYNIVSKIIEKELNSYIYKF